MIVKSGSGKTTTAKSMGKVFYEMGLLATAEVVECSAADLIGQYVGSTCPRTRSQFERGLGKVLIIDEAYRLAEGQYATEAVEEMIHLLSMPKYYGKIVVILAAHASGMNRLMGVNPNLAGYFQDEIVFKNLEPRECMVILQRELNQRKITAPFLEDPQSEEGKIILELFQKLTTLPSWNNARDIQTLAKKMTASIFQKRNGEAHCTVLNAEEVIACIKSMLDLQTSRKTNPSSIIRNTANMTHSHTYATQSATKSNPSVQLSSSTSMPLEVHCDTTANQNSDKETNTLSAESEAVNENSIQQKKKLTTQEFLQQLGCLGPCPAGFAWQENGNGYVCQGGNHQMSASEAQRLMASVQ